MATSGSSLTLEEFRLLYSAHRDLYSVLVSSLCRDPAESILVMAFWIWWERTGMTDVARTALSLPLVLTNVLADEAITCLDFLYGETITCPSDHDVALIQNLFGAQFSLPFHPECQVKVTEAIEKIAKEICCRAFADIYGSVVPPRTAGQSSAIRQQVESTSQRCLVDLESLPADRSMFITFSKGHPVSHYHVWQLFTELYGDCVESVNMQIVPPNEQVLFAVIIFRSEATVASILNGREKVKYCIDGKDIWVRKFEQRPSRRRASTRRPPRLLAHIPRCP